MRTKLLFTLAIAQVTLLLVNTQAQAQTVGISDVTFTPNTQAVLDLSSDRRGFLPPRLELNGDDLPISGTKPSGLMVYNQGGAIGPNGYYYWTGSTWAQVATVANTVSGSGTINYLSKFTPSGTVLGNSQIFDNGTNVGVGNAAPGHKLSVGDVTSDGQPVTIRGYSNSGSWKGGAAFGYTGAAVIMGELSGAAQIGGHNSTLGAWADLGINVGGGNVGFGTATPGAKVQVGPLNGNHLYLASGNNLYGWKIDTYDNGGGSVPFRLYKRTNGADTEALTILNQNGNVGINTTTPGAKFHVHTTGTGGIGISDDGWASIRMDGADNKSLWMHYGAASTNELRLARTGDGFGNWEANVIRFDMDAPGESIVLDGAGNLTVGTLAGSGDKMVIANNAGTLTTQAMPGGVLPAGTAAQTLYHNGTSWINTSNLSNDGSTITLGNFDSNNSDQWPLVQWRRDLGNNWDEGLMKGSSSRGAWGRTGFGIHMHSSRHFAFYSSGWDPLLDMEGGTGRLYIKGNTGIGNSNPAHHLSVGEATSDGQPVTIRGYSNTSSWKGGGAFGYTSATVIMGELNSVAQLAGHNGSLGAWANLAINSGGGNVAIGGSSPLAKLEVDHNGASSYGVGLLINQNAIGNSDGPKLQFRKTMTATKDWSLGILNGVDVGTFAISENGGVAGFGTSQLAIVPGGYVGIGLTNPAYRLDVAGGIRAQGSSMIGTGTDRLSLELQGTFHRMAFNELRFYDWNYGNDMVTFNEGNVGIGTTSPIGKLHAAGNHGNGVMADGNDRPSLAATGVYPQMVMMSGNSGNVNHGATLMLGGYDSGASGAHKHWSVGTAGAGSTFLDIGYHAGTDINPHAGIRNYNGTTMMTILNTGNVGIGTTGPEWKFHVEGVNTPAILTRQNGTHSYGITMGLETYDNGSQTQDGPRIGFHKRGAKIWAVGVEPYTNNGFAIWEDGYNGGWGTQRFVVSPGGNVGINNTAPAAALHVTGNAITAAIVASGGSYQTDWPSGWGGGFSSWDLCIASMRYSGLNQRSDRRLKNTIKSLDDMNAVEVLKSIRPVSYYYNDKRLGTNLRYGFIAQEIQEILPDLVETGTDEMKTLGVNYIDLIAVLTQAIKDQQDEIDELKSSNQTLQSDNEELKAALKDIKALQEEMTKIKANLYQEAKRVE